MVKEGSSPKQLQLFELKKLEPERQIEPDLDQHVQGASENEPEPDWE